MNTDIAISVEDVLEAGEIIKKYCSYRNNCDGDGYPDLKCPFYEKYDGVIDCKFTHKVPEKWNFKKEI